MSGFPQSPGRVTLFEQAPVPGVMPCSVPGRPAVFALLLVVAVILFGFGFLNPIWWMAAAALLFDSRRNGHDRGRSRDGRVRERRG